MSSPVISSFALHVAEIVRLYDRPSNYSQSQQRAKATDPKFRRRKEKGDNANIGAEMLDDNSRSGLGQQKEWETTLR
jgi:hypothetical protein